MELTSKLIKCQLMYTCYHNGDEWEWEKNCEKIEWEREMSSEWQSINDNRTSELKAATCWDS